MVLMFGGNSVSEIRDERKKLAHRIRRIVFNNDGDDISAPGADSVSGLLKARTTALLGSQVDAIWYYSSHGLKLYHQNGSFAELYRSPDLDGYATSNLERLMDREGKDALEVMVEACHAHGLEIFWSNRMNDIHDSFNLEILHYIKREHPEYMLSTWEEGKKYKYPDPRSTWSAWDFERSEIRDLTVAALREVCQNYDIDGLELDFVRFPQYFRPTMQFKPVEQRHLELMNDMVRRIRKMTEEEALKRGRAILLSARCVDDAVLSRSIGLDLETWLKENLIDILAAGSWLDFTLPMKPLFDLSHRYNVPVYSMVGNGNKGDFHDRMVWRGDAMYRFWEGADGIYMFNVFNPNLSLWWELGEPEKLLGTDKAYVWDYLPSQRKSSDLLHEVRLAKPFTIRGDGSSPSIYRGAVTVDENGCEPMPLMIGEDLHVPPPKGKHRLLTLRLHITGLSTKSNGQTLANYDLVIKLNGHILPEEFYINSVSTPRITDGRVALRRHGQHYTSREQSTDVWVEYRVEEELFQVGENLLEAVLANVTEGTKEFPKIDYIRLDVHFV